MRNGNKGVAKPYQYKNSRSFYPPKPQDMCTDDMFQKARALVRKHPPTLNPLEQHPSYFDGLPYEISLESDAWLCPPEPEI